MKIWLPGPVHIVEGQATAARYGGTHGNPSVAGATRDQPRQAQRETPIAVVLTRFTRRRTCMRRCAPWSRSGRHSSICAAIWRSIRCCPPLAVRATALAAWRLEDQWITAVRLNNCSAGWIGLDPRALQNDILTATFQHASLGPQGTAETPPWCIW